MALTSIVGVTDWPPMPISASTTYSSSNLLIDAADEKAGIVFDAPRDGDIDQIIFATGTVTTGGNVDVRLETVDGATGFPSGTLVDTNANVTVAVDAADDNVRKTATLTAAGTVTQGQTIAVVIVNPSSSFGNMQIIGTNDDAGVYPFGVSFAASWSASSVIPHIIIRYSDGEYYSYPGGVPGVPSNLTYNSGSAADEVGVVIVPQVLMRVRGAWVYADMDGDADIVLYNSSNTALATLSCDKEVRQGAAAGIFRRYFSAFDGSVSDKAPILLAGSTYRLVLKPTTTTGVSLQGQVMPSASAMNSLPGGQNIYSTSRADAGSWTNDTSHRYFIGLLVDAFDDGVLRRVIGG